MRAEILHGPLLLRPKANTLQHLYALPPALFESPSQHWLQKTRGRIERLKINQAQSGQAKPRTVLSAKDGISSNTGRAVEGQNPHIFLKECVFEMPIQYFARS